MARNNNTPLVVKKITIEQQTVHVQEFTKWKSRIEGGWEEKTKHAERMDDLVGECFKALKDDNKETNLTEVLRKREENKNLNWELAQRNNQINSYKVKFAITIN